jgi:L-alanine-DL-glutamate epimerase-like enolase superfamily enzyme
MQIQKVDIHLFNATLRQPIVTGYQTYTTNPVVILIMHADGLTGVAETTGPPGYSGETTGSILGAFDEIVPRILGMDPFDISKIHDQMDAGIKHNHAAKAAVDIAAYDLMGKASNKPIHKLIGGLYAEKLPNHMMLTIKSTKDMVADLTKFIEMGYRTFEVKVGLDPQGDIERITSLRKAAGPDVVLKFDANGGWTPSEAISILKKVEHLDIWAEQPSPTIQDLAQIRRAVTVPIVADECIMGPSDLIEVIRAQAADMVALKLLKFGGFFTAKGLCTIAEAASIPVYIDDYVCSRIANTAGLQLAVSTRDLFGCGFTTHTYLKEDLVKSGGITVKDGIGKVPSGPGLGLEIDEKYLGKAVKSYSK